MMSFSALALPLENPFRPLDPPVRRERENGRRPRNRDPRVKREGHVTLKPNQ
jgi:hypothetical protein